MSLIERITAKIEKLDHLCGNIIPEELDSNETKEVNGTVKYSEWKKA
ncbi:MAG: hypothetical protein IPH52_14345 [Leptospiraceae bacterium]|nr:hypothetical protein [Leptospiraceae bacterium]